MRLLTESEMGFVAGGGDGDEIVVTTFPTIEIPDDPGYHGPAPIPTMYGSTNGATYDSDTHLWKLPKHMTPQQIVAVAFNEAKGVDAAHRYEVMKDIIHVIMNNDGRSFEAASPIASAQGGEVDILRGAAAAYNAAIKEGDPTGGSTNWIMRQTSSTAPWLGLPVQYQVGPFDSAGTSYHYVDFFKDPAYAHG